jgi:hypothetical protein
LTPWKSSGARRYELVRLRIDNKQGEPHSACCGQKRTSDAEPPDVWMGCCRNYESSKCEGGSCKQDQELLPHMPGKTTPSVQKYNCDHAYAADLNA